MWICVSKIILRRSLMLTLAVFLALSSVFYFLQNTGMLAGGNIALVKLFWLVTVIFCWYVIPALVFLGSPQGQIKRVLALFLCNMILRGIIELLMMFWTQNWHPYYGIGHDIFSFILVLVFAVILWHKTALISFYLIAMAVLFAIESGFAWYMLTNVTATEGVVYYVPAEIDHQEILQLTQYVVIATLVYLVFFIRKFFYETSTNS